MIPNLKDILPGLSIKTVNLLFVVSGIDSFSSSTEVAYHGKQCGHKWDI